MDETVPINWIHISSDRRKIIVEGNNQSSPSAPGLLLFTVEPLGNSEKYNSTQVATEKFPGPLTLAVPVNDDSEISELAQKGMNSILNSLSTLVQDEIETRRQDTYEDFGEDFNFTVENLDSDHPLQQFEFHLLPLRLSPYQKLLDFFLALAKKMQLGWFHITLQSPLKEQQLEYTRPKSNQLSLHHLLLQLRATVPQSDDIA